MPSWPLGPSNTQADASAANPRNRVRTPSKIRSLLFSRHANKWGTIARHNANDTVEPFAESWGAHASTEDALMISRSAHSRLQSQAEQLLHAASSHADERHRLVGHIKRATHGNQAPRVQGQGKVATASGLKRGLDMYTG